MKKELNLLENIWVAAILKKPLIILEKKFGSPLITNDGVSIAKEIELENPYENMGAKLVAEVASKTNEIAGDGTTTATVLAQAMIREGLKNVTAGANPVGIRKGIDKAVAAALTELQAISRPVESKESIAQVAAISAADDEVGTYIADAMEKVGNDGVITIYITMILILIHHHQILNQHLLHTICCRFLI